MRTTELFVLGTLVWLRAGLLGAQSSSTLQQFQVDVAVPESPAFVLIGGTPSNLLRPTLMRDFSAGLSNFASKDGTVATPQNLGVEAAPAMLFYGRRLSLADYRKSPVLYRLQASVAINTATNRDAPNQIALGVRTSLLNGTDPRMDRTYQQSIDSVTAELLKVNRAMYDIESGGTKVDNPEELVDEPTGDKTPRTRDTVNVVACHRDLERGDEMSCVVTAATKQDPAAATIPLERQRERLNDILRDRRRRWEDQHWNARSLDVAGGGKVANRDSLGNDPAVQAVSVWTTYANPLATWGQWLVGGSLGWQRNAVTDNLRPQPTLSTRIYVGENQHRGYVEAEKRFNDPDRDGLVNLGGELRLRNSVWASVSAGLMFRPGDQKNRLVTGFTVRAAGP
jgi:hypothetical protein